MIDHLHRLRGRLVCAGHVGAAGGVRRCDWVVHEARAEDLAWLGLGLGSGLGFGVWVS